MEFESSLFVLLFTYAFVVSKHLMGAQKHIILKDFKWSQLRLGLTREFGFVLFLGLIYLLPTYVNIELLGLNLQDIVQLVLIYPLVATIKDAFDIAQELRHIDIDKQETNEIV